MLDAGSHSHQTHRRGDARCGNCLQHSTADSPCKQRADAAVRVGRTAVDPCKVQRCAVGEPGYQLLGNVRDVARVVLQLLGQVQVLCAELAQPAQLAAGEGHRAYTSLLNQLGQQVGCQHFVIQQGEAAQEG